MSIKEEMEKYKEIRKKIDKAITATSELRQALLEIDWYTEAIDSLYEMYRLANIANETILTINYIETNKNPWE